MKKFLGNRIYGLFPPPVPLEALNPQDILDLPFWRYRWQIYELWVLIVTLEELQQYGFVSQLSSDGDTLLEMHRHALVAARESTPACYLHYQPSFQNKNDNRVDPDVVLTTARDVRDIAPANTHMIIDAKQQKDAGGLEKKRKAHFEKTYMKYAAATMHDTAAILNYDTLPVSMHIPPNAHVHGEFHPGFQDYRGTLQQIIRDSFPENWLIQCLQRKVIIMDVSASMSAARFAARDCLKKMLAQWGSDTPIYTVRDFTLDPISSFELLRQLEADILCGAERADTLCGGVLTLAKANPIDHAIFITDLAGRDLAHFQTQMRKCAAPPWLQVLSLG